MVQPNVEVIGERKTNWYLVAGGIILILFAIGTFAAPVLFLEVITIMAGVGFLFAGLSGIATFIRTRGFPGSAWALVMAILDIIVGVMMLVHPIVFAPVLPWLLGVVFIAFGIVELVGTIPIGMLIPESRPVSVLSGVLTIIVGILFIMWPESLSLWIAAFAAVRGITLVIDGFLSRV